MCKDASDVGNESSGDDRTGRLREFLEREHSTLLRRIGMLVYKLCGPLRRDEIADRSEEALQETVKRALQAADRYDPQRSAMAWLVGFAARILQEQRRARARRPRAQSDLSDKAWQQVVDNLCLVDSEATTIRLDIRQAIARLTEPQQRLLQLRFFDGLDGEAFAQAAGAPTVGAARTRLARALQALRKQFGSSEGEVTP